MEEGVLMPNFFLTYLLAEKEDLQQTPIISPELIVTNEDFTTVEVIRVPL
jgi:hypothetical protein